MFIEPKVLAETSTVKIDDIKICYFDNKLISGKTPVIFIHGFPLNHKMWEYQLKELGRDRRVIAPDLRGFGCTGLGNYQYSIDLFADDLNGLMEKLGIKEVVIAGLSMGGYVALRFCEKYQNRVAGMILSDTKSAADTDHEKEKRFLNIKKIREQGLSFFIDGFFKSAFWEENISRLQSEIEKIRAMVLENDPLGIQGALLAMAARTSTSNFLRSVDVPVLILVGEFDKLATPSMAIWLRDQIRDSEIHLIKNAAHFSNVENPVDFTNYLQDFLRRRID